MCSKKLASAYDFSRKSIVITGGTGIIGSELSIALAQLGANVITISRSAEFNEGLKRKIDATPGSVLSLSGDVLDRKRLEEIAAEIKSKFGRVDALINAAGGNHPDASTSADVSFFELPAEALRKVADLNLLGVMLPSQVFGRLMAEQESGVVLNITSMNAFRPLTRIPAYSAAKAAVSNFTQWLAVYMAQEYSPKIRVNAIAPGFFLTRQNKFLLMDSKTNKLTPRGEKIIRHTPMGRFGNPEELIGAVLWLISSAAEFVTGIVLPIDGGFSAYSGV